MPHRHRLHFPASPSRVGSFVGVVQARLPGWAVGDLTGIAIAEALSNAIVHGALGLDSSRRDRGDLDGFLSSLERAEALHGSLRRVTVDVVDHGASVDVVVRDDGPGFDAARSPRRRGRGLALMQELSHESVWNESGNEVTLRWKRNPCP